MRDNPIICAFDMMDIAKACELASSLCGKVAMVKLGLEFFVTYGRVGVQKIVDLGVPVFLDLKLHDIPNTVEKAISALRGLEVAMLTVHVSGGVNMLKAAFNATSEANILLAGVTALTSIDDSDLQEIGITCSLDDYVHNMVKLAVDTVGLRAIVCSGHELALLRQKYQGIKLVVPGIRTVKVSDDQKRVKTPKEAIAEGADYLVIGRPITQSSSPVAAVDEIMRSLS